MKRIVLKSLSIFLTMLILVGIVPFSSLADIDLGITAEAAVQASGSCGPNAYWTLDSNGNMRISGTGAITSHPWWEEREAYWMAWWPIYKYTIKTLVIEDGITSICALAFRSAALQSITFGNTLETIGISAFEGCDKMKQEQLIIPASVKKISGASLYCSVKSIVIMNPLCEIVDRGSWSGDQEGDISFGVYSTNYRGTIYGYANSTAQAYSNQHSCTFLSIGNGILNDQKNDYVHGVDDFLVLEYNSLKRIENAEVNYDGTNLHIEKDAYYTIDLTSCGLTQIETPVFSLVPESTHSYISAVHCNGKDALIDDCSIGVSNTSLSGEAFNIQVYPAGYADIASYEILQNGAVIQSNNTGNFLLDPRTIPAGASLKVRAIDSNGQKQEPLETNIKTYEAKSQMDLSGKKISINLPNDIPIIGGAKFSVDLSTLPIFVMASENTVRIGIGASEKYNTLDGKTVSSTPVGSTTTENGKTTTSSLWQDWKKTVDNAVHDMKALEIASAFDAYKEIGDLMCESDSFMPKGNAKACAYAEFTLNDFGEVQSVDSNGILAIDMTMEKEWQTLVWGIPFVIGLTGKIGANCELDVGFDFENSEWYTNSDMSFTLPELTGKGGPGLAHVVELTAYAKIRNTINTSFISKYLSCVLNGELGVSGKFLCFSGEKPIWNFLDWQYYYTTWGDAVDNMGSRQKRKASIDNTTIYSVDSYNVDERAHLDNQSEWLGELPSTLKKSLASNASDKLLQSSIYETANPKVTTTDDGYSILTWIADIPERTTGNHPALVYSVYDNTSSSWSEPIILSDDGTTDGYQDIATDGQEVYVTWVNTNTVFDENITMSDLSKSCEISVAHFNKDTSSFDDAITVTKNDVMELIPSIEVKDGIAYIAYIKNSDSNPLVLTGTNSIELATIDAQNNCTTKTILSIDKPIFKIDVGFINNELSIAYLCDCDGSIESVNDVELFTVNEQSNITQVTNNDYQEQNVQFDSINGKTVLTYYLNGVIYYTNDNIKYEEISALANANYQFVDIGEQSILLYTAQDDSDSTNICASVYCNNKWSEQINLKSCGSDIKYFSAYDNNNTIGLVYSPVTYMSEITSIEENGKEKGNFSEVVDLYSTSIELFSDLKLIQADIDVEKVAPGVSIPITLLVRNEGFSIVDSLTVSSDNGFNSNMECEILPGKTEKIVFDFPIPKELTGISDINITVNTSEDDKTPDNNSKTIKLGYTSLSVSFAEYNSLKNKACLLSVSNDGSIATDCSVVFHKNAYDGEIVDSFLIKDLDAHSNQTFYFEWDTLKKYYKVGDTAFIEIKSLKEEFNTSDNFAFFVLSETKKEEYEYSLISENEIKLLSYNGADIDVQVPFLYDGYIVSQLGANIFSSKVQTVSLPSTIKQIDSKTFNSASSLKQIFVEDANESFCSIDGVLYNKDKTELIQYPQAMSAYHYEIHEDTKAIRDYAFYKSTLQELSLNEKVTKIGSSCFEQCRNLKSIDLKNVTIINDRAFYNSGLSEITIPENVSYIGMSAFNRCTDLTSVFFNAVNCETYSPFIPFSTYSTFDSSVSRIEIGNKVETIPDYVFMYTHISDISIPTTVMTIARSAFYNCVELKNVLFSEDSQLKEIKSKAFQGDSSLVEISIPNSVVSLGSSAFSNCKALESVKLPDSISALNSYTFNGCSSLKNIEIPETVTNVGANAFNGCAQLGTTKIHHTVASIGDNAFKNCNSLTIKCYDRTAAYNYAVSNSIPYEIIEVEADSICVNDFTVIKGTQTEMQYQISPSYSSEDVAFKCNNEKVATIDGNVLTAVKCGKATITATTESGKTDTCVVHVIGTENAEFTDFDYTLANENTTITITDYTGSDKDIVVPDTIAGLPVTYINSTFDGCTFENITISKNVSSWSTSNFNLATKLQNIYVASENEKYSSVDGVLYNNTGTALQKYPRGRTDSTFIIPETVTSIGANAFSYSNLESIRIPSNIKSISLNAFSSCSNLKSVYYDATNCSITSILNICPFPSCVENFIIGDSVESLPAYLLKGAAVKEIVIPKSVDSIHNNAFYNCSGLTIKAYANSCAKEYAENNGYNFVPITCGSCLCNEWEVEIDSTCTSVGKKSGICSVCGAPIIEEIPTKNHNYGDWEIIKEATCISEGLKTKTCADCGNVITETIAKTQHTYVATVIDPSCTKAGYTNHVCSVCGNNYTDNAVPATGHTDSDHDGICDICGEELEPSDPSKDRTCMCHKTGFMGFIYKIIRFFWKIFGINKTCSCGATHY